MEWIPIDLNNPLILLRVYLAAVWGATTVYGIRVFLAIPRGSSRWPLAIYSVIGGLLGAASYFLGAATTFHSPGWFLSVAAMLTFTPVALVLWLNYAKVRADLENGPFDLESGP